MKEQRRFAGSCRPRITRSAALVAILSVGGCSGVTLPDTGIYDPSPERFAYCRDHTCQTIREISLSADEWSSVTAGLHEPAASAEAERLRVSEAVGTFERVVGVKAGTLNDRGGTLVGYFLSDQLDCVDEASNTNTLLAMLERDGLLRWHRRGKPSVRLDILSDGVTHFTATVVETANGEAYAVDSWFRDNGHPADVVPLAEWKDGWNPPP